MDPLKSCANAFNSLAVSLAHLAVEAQDTPDALNFELQSATYNIKAMAFNGVSIAVILDVAFAALGIGTPIGLLISVTLSLVARAIIQESMNTRIPADITTGVFRALQGENPFAKRALLQFNSVVILYDTIPSLKKIFG